MGLAESIGRYALRCSPLHLVDVICCRSFGADDLEMKMYATSIGTSYEKGAKKAAAYGVFVGAVLHSILHWFYPQIRYSPFGLGI